MKLNDSESHLDFKDKKDNGNILLDDKIHKETDLLILNYNKNK